MWGLRRPILWLVVLGVLGIAGWRVGAGWRPAADDYPVQGVDVSAANGPIDWNAVSAGGADFGYALATSGAMAGANGGAAARDPAFETNWRAMAEAGVRRGAVHAYSLCRLAVDQANAFNTMVPRDAADLPAAVDIAYDAGCDARPDRAVLVGEIVRFLTMAEAHLGKPMILRVSRAVERDYRLTAAIPRTVWATGNVFPPDYAARPWRMWRASDFRRVEGIRGPVNWDVVRP